MFCVFISDEGILNQTEETEDSQQEEVSTLIFALLIICCCSVLMSQFVDIYGFRHQRLPQWRMVTPQLLLESPLRTNLLMKATMLLCCLRVLPNRLRRSWTNKRWACRGLPKPGRRLNKQTWIQHLKCFYRRCYFLKSIKIKLRLVTSKK